MYKTDLKHPVRDLPLLSRNELVASKLCHSLVPQLEHSESFGPFQLFVAHKVKLLLQMFQTEVVWSGYLAASGHLTNHRTKTSSSGECGPSSSSLRAAPEEPGTYFKQLHDGGILRIVGVQTRLRCPFTDFFRIIQSRCTDVRHSIQVAKTTKGSSYSKSNNTRTYMLELLSMI